MTYDKASLERLGKDELIAELLATDRMLSDCRESFSGSERARIGEKQRLAEASVERDRLEMKLAAVQMAAEGKYNKVSHITEDHEHWTPALKLMSDVWEASRLMVYTVSETRKQAKTFMQPDNLVRIDYKCAREWILQNGADPTEWPEDWNDLPESARVNSGIVTKHICDAFDQHMNMEWPEDPVVTEILNQGNALFAALQRLEKAEGNQAYQELSRLEAFMREKFPKLAGLEEPPYGSVDQAITMLTIVHDAMPAMVRFIWNQVLRPAAQLLNSAGVSTGVEPLDQPNANAA